MYDTDVEIKKKTIIINVKGDNIASVQSNMAKSRIAAAVVAKILLKWNECAQTM